MYSSRCEWIDVYVWLLFIRRLERFLEKAHSVLDYFGPYLGRIEIMGSANKIERVYFEIKQSHIDQWEKPQIKVKNKARPIESNTERLWLCILSQHYLLDWNCLLFYSTGVKEVLPPQCGQWRRGQGKTRELC